MLVKIYHRDHERLYPVWEGELDKPFPDCRTDQFLDHLYCRFQWVGTYHSPPKDYHHRSLDVGDVIELGARRFRVKDIGFEEATTEIFV